MKYGHIIIIIILILGIISCKEKQQKRTLLYSPGESTICDKKIILDSIVIIRTKKNITIRQYRGDDNYLEIVLIKTNNGFSELRKKFYGYIENETDKRNASLMPIDSLPILYVRDTVFNYKSNRKFYPTTIDLSLGNGLYKIEKDYNKYVSIRKSTIDSSYVEAYYYDMDFNIIKYKVNYRGNICIYK